MANATCPQCACLMPQASSTKRGPKPTYCTPVCQVKAKQARTIARNKAVLAASRVGIVCETCGSDLSARRAVRFCSKRCSDIAYGNTRAIPLPAQICAAPMCDVVFIPVREGLRCCSRLCNKRLYLIENPQAPEPWDDRRRDNRQKRDALKKGSGFGSPVRRDEIAERDGYLCGICHKKVNMALAWPKPGSPSLDHIIPLTKGGIHDPVNVQLAHLRCNIAKGNRATGEQLLLIG